MGHTFLPLSKAEVEERRRLQVSRKRNRANSEDCLDESGNAKIYQRTTCSDVLDAESTLELARLLN